MKQLITNPYSFDAYEVKKDSQGRGIVRARIMTTGRLKYIDKNGNVFFGNISLDELKSAKERNTASLKPITVRHPPGMLSPSDVTKYQEGMSGEGFVIEEYDGKPWLVGPVVLQTDTAISAAENGEFGVSSGYQRKAVPTGVDGEFDFKDIDINHIAIACKNPRAEGASISLDEAEDDSARIYSFANQQKPKKKEVIMKQKLIAVKVGDFSLDEASIEYDETGTGTEHAIAKYDERETKLVEKLELTQASMDNAQIEHDQAIGDLSGENKVLKAKLEELEKEKEGMVSLDDIDTMVEERAEIQNGLDTRGIKSEFKTVLEGKRLVVEHDFPNVSFDDAQIDGAYKTRNLNEGDLNERRKSKEALLKLKNGDHSMDSGNRISFSQLDIKAMIRNKQLKKRRA